MRRAFTLLEAVLALAILAGAIMACLQIRGQMLAGAQRLRDVQRADRAEEALFEMLVNNALPAGRLDKERGVVVWNGDYLGSPYEVERYPMIVDNPVAGRVPYTVASQVTVFKYVMHYAGRESEIVWHR